MGSSLGLVLQSIRDDEHTFWLIVLLVDGDGSAGFDSIFLFSISIFC